LIWNRCPKVQQFCTCIRKHAIASVAAFPYPYIAQFTGEAVSVDPATGVPAKGGAGAEPWSRAHEKSWEMSV
jgi:hypothetical protein